MTPSLKFQTNVIRGRPLPILDMLTREQEIEPAQGDERGPRVDDVMRNPSFLNSLRDYQKLMTAEPGPPSCTQNKGKEMSAFERVCFVLVTTSLIVLVAASAAFLIL